MIIIWREFEKKMEKSRSIRSIELTMPIGNQAQFWQRYTERQLEIEVSLDGYHKLKSERVSTKSKTRVKSASMGALLY